MCLSFSSIKIRFHCQVDKVSIQEGSAQTSLTDRRKVNKVDKPKLQSFSKVVGTSWF